MFTVVIIILLLLVLIVIIIIIQFDEKRKSINSRQIHRNTDIYKYEDLISTVHILSHNVHKFVHLNCALVTFEIPNIIFLIN